APVIARAPEPTSSRAEPPARQGTAAAAACCAAASEGRASARRAPRARHFLIFSPCVIAEKPLVQAPSCRFARNQKIKRQIKNGRDANAVPGRIDPAG